MRGYGRRVAGSSLRDVALEPLEVLLAAVEHPGHEVRDELLGEVEQPVEAHPGDLRLHHPELHEVPAGLRLLRTEGRAEAVDLAVRGGGGLEVELPGLREVRRVAEVVGLEQRGGSLARRRRQDRRVDVHVVALVEELADAERQLVAHPHDRVLPLGAQPQVAVVQQEVGAVLLGGDRVLGAELHDRRGPRPAAPRRRARACPP